MLAVLEHPFGRTEASQGTRALWRQEGQRRSSWLVLVHPSTVLPCREGQEPLPYNPSLSWSSHPIKNQENLCAQKPKSQSWKEAQVHTPSSTLHALSIPFLAWFRLPASLASNQVILHLCLLIHEHVPPWSSPPPQCVCIACRKTQTLCVEARFSGA